MSALGDGRARISLWGGGPWADPGHEAQAREVAAEVEELGYHRLWLSNGQGERLLPGFAVLLDATTTLGVASGIASIFTVDAARAAADAAVLEAAYPGRFLLGLGNSHRPLVERAGRSYGRPYTATVEYLDELDATGEPAAAADSRVLAALGPRMLRLSGERSVGAHPYFTTPAHTASARAELGSGPLLAPEVAVVLDTDAGRARAVARDYMAMYLRLPNYTNSLRTFGYGDDDLGGGGSDRLVDELIPWGDPQTVAAGIARHVDAGADEVTVQVLTGDRNTFARRQFRDLAAVLTR